MKKFLATMLCALAVAGTTGASISPSSALDDAPGQVIEESTILYDADPRLRTSETAYRRSDCHTISSPDPATVFIDGTPVPSGAKMDWCWEKLRVPRDGDPNWDYYMFHVYGTAMDKTDSNGVSRRVKSAQFDVTPRSTTGLQWYKWKPGGDQTGACNSVDVSLSMGAVSIGRSFSACETWDVTKRATPGSMRNTWTGPSSGTSSDRELALVVGVKVPQGAAVPLFKTSVWVKGICTHTVVGIVGPALTFSEPC